jgi:hypothetical protein
MEIVGTLALGLGGLIAFIGWVWLIVLGFKHGGALWGILIILFSWLAGLVFCIMHKTGWIPLILMILGGIVAGAGMVPLIMKQLENMPKTF